ncbi:MAG TPA: RDD family protein [Dinghuibacter sp.]|uniref:RDD family protein n=1 Tax=Dinghuibacter sp. TaxID=2024697 RepID=UPI002C5CC1B2|nr:RDD family protein [Dinghuibacter sp.]HTJ14279.1 RDD family protein [Dinghuibacter sp.]
MTYHESEGQTEVTSDLENLLAPSPASAGLRFANFIIDYVILYVISFGAGMLLALSGLVGFAQHPSLEERLRNILIFSIIFVVYYTLMEGATGKTIGKMCTGTRVIRDDTGERITFKDALLRSLSRLVPFEVFSGFGFPWHDTWTQTTVVRNI